MSSSFMEWRGEEEVNASPERGGRNQRTIRMIMKYTARMDWLWIRVLLGWKTDKIDDKKGWLRCWRALHFLLVLHMLQDSSGEVHMSLYLPPDGLVTSSWKIQDIFRSEGRLAERAVFPSPASFLCRKGNLRDFHLQLIIQLQRRRRRNDEPRYFGGK